MILCWMILAANKMLKLIPLLLLFFIGCTKKDSTLELAAPESLSGKTMGTSYSIKYYSGSKSIDRIVLQKSINQTLEKINLEMSTYIPESEIQKFNALKTSDSWFTVSPGFHWVTKVALKLAQETGGVYDPTIGPLIDLWGFGPAKKTRVPTAQEIEATLKVVGHEKIVAHESEALIRKIDPKARLDLSSIAKGWGVDQVGKLLEANGIAHYMVEIGGEVKTFGGKPNGELWNIGVAAPVESDVTETQKILELKDQALATSGDYRNFIEKDGKRFTHVLNAKTGKPVESALASVSVVDSTGDCALADGYATALLAMGEQAAQAFATERKLAVFFISHTPNGTFSEWMTPEFTKYIKNK